MGRIYQRSSSGPYYGYWTDQRGKSHRRSLRTRDAVVARARLRELELAATNAASYSRHPLSLAVTHMLEAVEHENAADTWKFYERKAGHLLRVLGPDTDLADVTREQLLGYVRHRKVETASTNTIHKELMAMRRVLGEALERKLWSGDVDEIVPTVKNDYRPRETWLTEHQAKQLVARVADRRRLWVTIAIWGGLCSGEIERLEWPHVDLRARVLHVPGTKRQSRRRTIPLSPVLLDALTRARGNRTSGPVVERWGNVRRDLHRAAELAKLPIRPSPNDLRRTFASLMLNARVTPIVVAKLLGHASTKMVELVYGRISAQTFRSAVATLPLSDSDRCAAGEQNACAFSATDETKETCFGHACAANDVISLDDFVPRDGVEPPTRGFSVPGERKDHKRLKAM